MPYSTRDSETDIVETGAANCFHTSPTHLSVCPLGPPLRLSIYPQGPPGDSDTCPGGQLVGTSQGGHKALIMCPQVPHMVTTLTQDPTAHSGGTFIKRTFKVPKVCESSPKSEPFSQDCFDYG